MHIEDQVGAKRCGHRPNKAIARKKRWWIGSARRWMRKPILFCDHGAHRCAGGRGAGCGDRRAQAYVEAGAEMLFPEAITDSPCIASLPMRCRYRSSPTLRIWRNTAVYHRRITQRPCRKALYPLSAFRAMNRAAEHVYTSCVRKAHRKASSTPCRPATAVRKHQLLPVRREARRPVCPGQVK